MANEEHLALLSQGIDTWNKWRQSNSNIQVDLSEARLRGTDLRGADLSGANLKGTDLRGADLKGANFRGAALSWAHLSKADLSRANFWLADLSGADLSWAILSDANLSGVNLSWAHLWISNCTRANFNKADLSGANLNGVNLTEADLSGTNLTGVNLGEANLTEADFSEADLSGANFSYADLKKATLNRANLEGANLREANLTQANFVRSILFGANLTRTQVAGANFATANLTGTCLHDWQIDETTQLKGAICEYVYLRGDREERCPANGNFAPGDFAKLFQQSVETVSLTFRNGIDWLAFSIALQKLQVNSGGSPVSLQALEYKNDGAFVVRVNVPTHRKRDEQEQELKREYVLSLQAIDESYRTQSRMSEEQIATYRRQSADLTEIVRVLAHHTQQSETLSVANGQAD